MPYQLITPPVLSGDGSKKSIASVLGVSSFKWAQLTGVTIGNEAASRIGDVNVSATQGFPLSAGDVGQFLPALDEDYNAEQIYFTIADGDTAILVACVKVGG
jgi:hypothetical protein